MTTKEDTINKALQTISTQSQEFSSFNEFCIANNVKNEPLARSIKCHHSTIARARKDMPMRPKVRKKLLKFFPTLDPKLIIEWNSDIHHSGNIKSKAINLQLKEQQSAINQLLNITKELQSQIDKLKEELELLS